MNVIWFTGKWFSSAQIVLSGKRNELISPAVITFLNHPFLLSILQEGKLKMCVCVRACAPKLKHVWLQALL